ncbi:16S rRNA (cytidine(1402)-2'-O)-methyltransferase [Candidatus Caldatribacterium sp. SIUC1]|uniref:16S rRNA (cytidine(1402)-2'-O)-methyltransferase n=1 Tax=Candidatus Caldatribacterium sp. SIUC1 TaxID=3418365 RepID=UPI003F692EBC
MGPEKEGWGKVYFCPTPIGNLRDITLRVLDVLKEADCIACEDTRVTLKLLNAYRIRKPLLRYHAHNVSQATRDILRLVREGKVVAFVSDAGMPGIQDPGMELVLRLLEEGIPFEVLPGPSASLLGVVYSGFAFSGFTFLGFLPRKGKEREETLRRALFLPQATVLYESPRRLLKTLGDIREIAGERRRVLVARELTKIHEEILRGTVAEVEEMLKGRDILGEVVIVVEGAPKSKEEIQVPGRLLELLRRRGFTQKDIVALLSEGLGIEKNVLKRQLSALGEVENLDEG